jgi:hypothetical protein
MKPIISIAKEEASDTFTCSCGNTADWQGFSPVDENGNLLEDFGEDGGEWFAQCDKCEQIYKMIEPEFE